VIRPRRDATGTHHRILDAAREVLGGSGADAGMDEIAARAHVGIGTVYRRFASKDALIDELLRLATEELTAAADRALARPDGHGLEDMLRALGRSFADHARYANLLLERHTDSPASRRLRAAINELTTRAAAVGTIAPSVTPADIMALIWAMRGLIQAAEQVTPQSWQRFRVGQPPDVRPQKSGPQEQRIEVEPDVPVIPGAQVEVPAPGLGQLDHSGIHPGERTLKGVSQH
jgi:AcrR family transcriptional regulator